MAVRWVPKLEKRGMNAFPVFRRAACLALLLCAALCAASFSADAAATVEIAFDRTPHRLADGPEGSVRFSADAPEVSLTVFSRSPEWIEAEARLTAEQAGGTPQGAPLAEDGLFLAPGERKALRLAPSGGFRPGRYRVLLDVGGSSLAPMTFEVVAKGEARASASEGASLPTPSPELLKPPAGEGRSAAAEQAPETPRSGLNIALGALGGKVERWTSQFNDRAFAAANLVDGLRSQTIGGDVDFCNPCGWRAEDATFPQELVFSFYRGREALVDAVVIDTASLSPMESGKPMASRFPVDVEVWTADAERPGEFVLRASAALEQTPGAHVVAFPPARARFLKLRILSTQGRAAPQLAEVGVLEAAEPERSVVRDLPRDIASPALGGAMVWFTSDERGNEAGMLLEPGGQGWRSADGSLPQSFVFAFHRDRIARIGSVEIAPSGSGPKTDPASLPRTVALSVSDSSPVEGFREVARVAFSPGEGTKTVPIHTPARFLRVDVLENHGGKSTVLGHVRIFEDPDPSALSVLSEYSDPGRIPAEGSAPGSGGRVTAESEPNDTPVQAGELTEGSVTTGVLEPAGDVDYYRFRLDGSEPRRLHADFSGRAAAELLTSSGDVLSRIIAGADPGRTVQPGEYLLKVFTPPSSVVLVWDASRSMKGVLGELGRAVREYLESLPRDVRVRMIEFADRPRTLLPSFSSDKRELLGALEGAFTADMGSVLYDALAEGARLLAEERGERTIVVFCDGGTEGSRTRHSALWKALRESGIRVSAIGFGASLDDWNGAIGSSNERMLRHIALATGGRFLRAESDEELAALYRLLADDLRGDPAYSVGIRFSGGTGRLNVLPREERATEIMRKMPPRMELILDASGSMNRRIGGKDSPRRIDLAKKALVEVIDSLPDSSIVALRVFGRRIREGRKGACQDTELLVPFGPLDKTALKKKVQGIQALGTTPIAYSLKKAGEDFPPGPGERRILLITDGKEECGGDPAATVAELRRSGLTVRVDVVGFALEDEADREASRRVAETSGGLFFDTRDGEGLKEGILRTLSPAFDVLGESGEPVAHGVVGGGPLDVPEGTYTLALHLADGVVSVPGVRIEHGRMTEVRLDEEAGRIVGRPSLPAR